MHLLFTENVDSPLGPMVAGATENGLCLLEFCEPAARKQKLEAFAAAHELIPAEAGNQYTANALLQLREFFEKNRTTFDVPLDLFGTDFQKKVWNSLAGIPFGKKATYLQQTKRLGDVKAIRAVASANGKNPIAIILPCHRVLGSNGELTGYAGGLHRKKWLLEFEGVLAAAGTLFP